MANEPLHFYFDPKHFLIDYFRANIMCVASLYAYQSQGVSVNSPFEWYFTELCMHLELRMSLNNFVRWKPEPKIWNDWLKTEE